MGKRLAWRGEKESWVADVGGMGGGGGITGVAVVRGMTG